MPSLSGNGNIGASGSGEFVFFMIFTHIAARHEWIQGSTRVKRTWEEFLTVLARTSSKSQVLNAYKSSFSYVLKNYDSQSLLNLIRNAFVFIDYTILEDSISLKDLPFFVESIVYCLTD